MFSSISNFSLPFGIRLSRGDASSSIPLESVEIHDIEIRNEKRARALKHLLKLNHANHSILFNHNRFHNHMPHVRIQHVSSTFADFIYELDLRICLPIRIKSGAAQYNL